jgi:hypothetical protein
VEKDGSNDVTIGNPLALLPHQLYSVAGKDSISAEDGQRFGQGLGNEETVEGVAMVVRERFKLKDVFVADGKELHAVRVHLVAEVGDGGTDGVELAGLDLDGI